MKKLLLLLLVLAICIPVFGQEVSQRQEIAVFGLSYYDWNIPGNILGAVDSAIQDVFVNIGRFDVTGMQYRLAADDINAFINEIRKVKEQNIEIPEEVRFGQVTFTEADFNRLVGSFIVVVPVVSYYNIEYNKRSEKYEAEVRTSFSFINIEEQKTIAHFSIKTVGSSESSTRAGRDAVDSIPMQLAYEIRSVDAFQLRTGILDIAGRRIMVELGTDLGVNVGDEFALVQSRILPTGHSITEEIGLLEITEVLDTVSYARVVFARPSPVVGDQLREIPRYGFELEAYFHLANTNLGAVSLPGVRIVGTRGFRRVRPFYGLEIPVNAKRQLILYGLPLTMYLGAELNWSFGRIQVLPSISVGASGIIPAWELNEEDPDFHFSHIGGAAQVSFTYLLTRNARLQLDGGIIYYNSINSILASSYYGPYGGIGIKYKF